MGSRIYNLNAFCDYATLDKHSAVELHMKIPIPHADLQKVQGWIGSGDWSSAETYLTGKYFQHRALLSEWIAGSRSRRENNDPRAHHIAAS